MLVSEASVLRTLPRQYSWEEGPWAPASTPQAGTRPPLQRTWLGMVLHLTPPCRQGGALRRDDQVPIGPRRTEVRRLWPSDRQARGLYEGQERPGRMELGSAALPEGASLTCASEWPWLWISGWRCAETPARVCNLEPDICKSYLQCS